MPKKVLDLNTIQDSRVRMGMTIRGHEIRLRRAKKDLEILQESCPHPDEQSRLEYDFTAHWCNICGKHWSTRR
jgi:hypothetical protein